jgi:peroxin-6
MEVQNGIVHPRKRRRRRRVDQPAITARLLLDDRMKGEVGILSDDLFNDLFPWAQETGTARKSVSSDQLDP